MQKPNPSFPNVEKNRFSATLPIVFAVTAWAILSLGIVHTLGAVPENETIINYLGWPDVICMIVVSILVVWVTVGMVGEQLMDLQTELTSDGIRRPTWRGVVFWRWEEISTVSVKGKYLEVTCGPHSVKLLHGTFKDTMAVWGYIMQKVYIKRV